MLYEVITLGTVLLTLFSLQFITGILLLMHYVPDTEKAFASVEHIVNDVVITSYSIHYTKLYECRRCRSP